MSDDMQSRLQSYYAGALPAREALQIDNLTRISDGWESEVYAFDLEYGRAGERQREALILRIYPGSDAERKAAHEFRGMMRLRQAGYPVPQVLILERDHSPFGRPFIIMGRINGEILWPLISRASDEKQRELLTLFSRLLIRLHRLEWAPFADDPSPYNSGDPFAIIDRQLAQWRSFYEQFPRPGFWPVFEWLEKRRDRVPCLQPAPIHWDFHPANVLLQADGSAVVIDWTQLELSDPRFDLAWTLLLVGTQQSETWRDFILQAYERLAGANVEELAYFEVAACLKRSFSVVVSLSEGAEKLGMRPGAEAAMRRMMNPIKKVYDLLLERTGIEVPEMEDLLASVS